MSVTRRVLVVEDDDDLRRSLERVLTKDNCEVTGARDGQEAIDKLAGGLAVDLVITDLEMPRAGGREVLDAATSRGFPVVILTAHSSVAVAVELMRKGSDELGAGFPLQANPCRAFELAGLYPRAVSVGLSRLGRHALCA